MHIQFSPGAAGECPALDLVSLELCFRKWWYTLVQRLIKV